MTRGKDICDMCDTWHKFDNHEMCHTMTQMTQKIHKPRKYAKLENEIDVTHCDTIRHCDTCVTPKVFNFCDFLKTAKGTVGACTYLFNNRVAKVGPKNIFLSCTLSGIVSGIAAGS
jgi:hypothetical protein